MQNFLGPKVILIIWERKCWIFSGCKDHKKALTRPMFSIIALKLHLVTSEFWMFVHSLLLSSTFSNYFVALVFRRELFAFFLFGGVSIWLRNVGVIILRQNY